MSPYPRKPAADKAPTGKQQLAKATDEPYFVLKVTLRVTASSQQAAEQKVVEIFLANPAIQRVRAEAE